MSDRPIERYPLLLRVLHWGLAALLAVQLALGFVAEHAASPATSAAVLAFHARLGLLILGLMVVRLGLRLALPVPPAEEPALHGRGLVRRWVHGLLYLLVVALPVSGHVGWVWMGADRQLVGGVEVPALFVPPDDETWRALAWYAHRYAAWTLLALACLHAGAAMHRSRTRRDGFIGRRMGFGSGPGRAGDR